jgi:hypothetical protein
MKRWRLAGRCEAVVIAALAVALSRNNNCEIKHNLAGNKAHLGRARMTGW